MSKKMIWIDQASPWRGECIALCQERKWQVDVCEMALIGIGKVQKVQPDIVIIGPRLPDCQSLSVVKNIRSAPQTSEKTIHVYVLMDQALQDKFEREHEKWEGLAYFIKLPVEAKKFVQWLENPALIEGHSSFIPDQKPVQESEPQTKASARDDKKSPQMAIDINTDEVSTLKNYIAMKEKEIVELSQDLHRAKEQLQFKSNQASETDYEHAKMKEQLEDYQKKVELLTNDNDELRTQHNKELKSRELEIQTKIDKLSVAERKLDLSSKKYEEMKERVRRDIQHIRVHEKELEARLEILKKDSETLLQAKDKKLLEFKRKLDSLEYDIEMLREKEQESNRKVQFWRARIERVLRALRLGSSLLESDSDDEIQELEKSGEIHTKKVA